MKTDNNMAGERENGEAAVKPVQKAHDNTAHQGVLIVRLIYCSTTDADETMKDNGDGDRNDENIKMRRRNQCV